MKQDFLVIDKYSQNCSWLFSKYMDSKLSILLDTKILAPNILLKNLTSKTWPGEYIAQYSD